MKDDSTKGLSNAVRIDDECACKITWMYREGNWLTGAAPDGQA